MIDDQTADPGDDRGLSGDALPGGRWRAEDRPGHRCTQRASRALAARALGPVGNGADGLESGWQAHSGRRQRERPGAASTTARCVGTGDAAVVERGPVRALAGRAGLVRLRCIAAPGRSLAGRFPPACGGPAGPGAGLPAGVASGRPPAFRAARQRRGTNFWTRLALSTSAVNRLPSESIAMLWTQWNWPAIRPLRPKAPTTLPLWRSMT